MSKTRFEWDENKNISNVDKHNISFEETQYAFTDVNRIIAKDLDHSNGEQRFFISERLMMVL